MANIQVEVAYATSKKQFLKTVMLNAGDSVRMAIEISGVLDEFSELQGAELKTGIFSRPCQLDAELHTGDRVEIYRPLRQNPMDARRSRALNPA